MHEVEGEQGRAAQGHRGFAKQVFQEHVEYGRHQHTKQGAHEPPASGDHAEYGDADGEDQLAQGRVGYLVGIHVVQVLQRRAGVVDLVEIGRVHIGGLIGPQAVLVKQGLDALVRLVGDGQGRSLIPQGQLGQPQPLLPGGAGGGEAEPGGGDGPHRLAALVAVAGADLQAVLVHVGRKVQHVPFEQGVIGLFRPDALPCPILRLPFQGVVPGAQGSIEGNRVHRHGLVVGELKAVPLLELHPVLGDLAAAQLEKGGEGVYRCQRQDGRDIPFFHGMAGQGEGQAAGFGRFLRHGNPLQAAGAGAQAVPVIAEKGPADQYAQDGQQKRGGQVGEKPGDAFSRRLPEGGPGALQGGGGGGQGKDRYHCDLR